MGSPDHGMRVILGGSCCLVGIPSPHWLQIRMPQHFGQHECGSLPQLTIADGGLAMLSEPAARIAILGCISPIPDLPSRVSIMRTALAALATERTARAAQPHPRVVFECKRTACIRIPARRTRIPRVQPP